MFDLNVKCLREVSEFLRITSKEVSKQELKDYVVGSCGYSKEDFDVALAATLEHDLVTKNDGVYKTTYKMVNETKLKV